MGFDVGKAFHWVCVLDRGGGVLLSRRVEATERELGGRREEIAAFGAPGDRSIGLDLVGGPATLLQAVLLGAASACFTSLGRRSTAPATATAARTRATRGTP